VIRANLLPKARRLTASGLPARNGERRRGLLLGAALAALVGGIAVSIESFRIARLSSDLRALDALVARNAASLPRVTSLAVDVARYERIERELARTRESGNEAATFLARIGNGLPKGTWVAALDRDARGLSIEGHARSVDGVGDALSTLETAVPSATASLVSIERTGGDPSDVRFTVRVTKAKPGAPPAETIPEPFPR
jgi:Tfp pilus assembly protein PilN